MTGHLAPASATTPLRIGRWIKAGLAPLATELRQHWQRHVIIALVVAACYQHLLFNLTPSLPYVLAVLERGATVQRGDLVVFRFQGGEIGPYLKGQWFFKRVAGMPGDTVSVEGQNVFVNATPVGFAKPRTHTGEPLELIAPGPIPPGRYYVQGTHPDSFDSRYRVNGLIRADQIVGVAHPVF
jgi:conjugal transfer pilin signal peptidase TrbI